MAAARAILLVALPGLLVAQLAFDVASIKPTAHGRDANGNSHSSIDVPSPGRLVAENASLSELIREAYEIKEYQLSGPTWLNDDNECFDIAARAPATTSERDVRLMMQTLLAERFHLAIHRETRVLPMYRLVAGKRGPNLRAAANPDGSSGTRSAGGNVTYTNVSMAELAHQLSRDLKRPVSDATGLEGSFDMKLQYDPSDSGAGPSLFTAVQEQLGLRLESAKGPVEIVVVDHIDRAPTAN